MRNNTASFRKVRNLLHAVGKDETTQPPPRLELLQTVRCLECSAVYSKPSGGGTATANPGCPECGYVGWVKTTAPITEPSLQRRSVAGPLRQSSA
jgi:phage FluMu protein Com